MSGFEKEPMYYSIWKSITWMPGLIYWIYPDGIIISWIAGIFFSIILFPAWMGTALLVLLYRRLIKQYA